MKKAFQFFVLCFCIFTSIQASSQSWIPVGGYNFTDSPSSSPSLAIDRFGTPYLAFQDSGLVSVMKYDGSNWVFVGNRRFSVDGGFWPSIAVDGDGVPYIVYRGFGFGVTVMKYNDSAWSIVGLADFTPGTSGGICCQSIAIDKNNTPYVSFIYNFIAGLGDSHAFLYKYAGGSWHDVGGSISDSVYSQTSTSIAIDSSGAAYVAYMNDDYTHSTDVVSKYDSSTGMVNVGGELFATANSGNPSVAVDKHNIPYVAYSSTCLSVAKFVDSNWVPVGGQVASGSRYYQSMAIDRNNTPFVVSVASIPGFYWGVATVNRFNGVDWDSLGSFGIQAAYTSVKLIIK